MKYEQMVIAELNELAKLAYSEIKNEIDDAITETRHSIVWCYHDMLLTIGHHFAKQLQKERRLEYAEATLKCLFGIKEEA